MTAENRMLDVTASLRATTEAAKPPTFQQVKDISDYLCDRDRWGAHLSLTPAQLATKLDIDLELVFDIVSGLGTFIGQIRKQSAGKAVRPDRAPDVTAAERAEYLGSPLKGRGRRRPSGDQIELLPTHAPAVFIQPHGWDRASCGREVERVVANIAKERPDDAFLRRWMLRQWGNASVFVSYELLCSIWTLARLGRVAEIEKLTQVGSSPNGSFARALADTWDLLEVSRADAVAAVANIVDLGGDDPAATSSEVARCRWISEGDLTRIGDLADAVLRDDSRRGDLVAAVSALVGRIEADPDRFRPSRVADLEAGQIRRLAESAGLEVESDPQIRREVHEQVAAAGLSADADRLIPLGVEALRRGLADEFSEALTRRAAGELDWADDLHDVLGIT